MDDENINLHLHGSLLQLINWMFADIKYYCGAQCGRFFINVNRKQNVNKTKVGMNIGI